MHAETEYPRGVHNASAGYVPVGSTHGICDAKKFVFTLSLA